MPAFAVSPQDAAGIIHHLISEVLKPANGYLGSLLIAQFYTGLVPDEVQDQYQVYGSLYDMTPRRVQQYLPPMDHSKPNENEAILEQVVQVSIWSDVKAQAASASNEIRNLLNSYPVPVEYANLVVTNIRAANSMTVQEEDRVWQSLFDVTLTLEE